MRPRNTSGPAPRGERGDAVIPHSANSQTAGAGDVPRQAKFLRRRRKAEVDYGAERTGGVKCCQAGKDSPSFQAAIPIGHAVIQEKVSRHDDESRDCQGLQKTEVENSHQYPKYDRSEQHAHGAHDAEDQKTNRHDVADLLVNEQLQVFETDSDIQFAGAVQALAKSVRNLADPQGASRRGDHVKQDLETDPRGGTNDFFQKIASHNKKAPHRIVTMSSQ